MLIEFKLEETFPVPAEVIYNSWLDSEQHSLMTGGAAECSREHNGAFTAWDGYISGCNKSLTENHKIVQSWRTFEFDAEDKDSDLLIELQETKEGCLVSITHTNIPEGQPDYKQGWTDHYFNPMKEYFEQF